VPWGSLLYPALIILIIKAIFGVYDWAQDNRNYPLFNQYLYTETHLNRTFDISDLEDTDIEGEGDFTNIFLKFITKTNPNGVNTLFGLLKELLWQAAGKAGGRGSEFSFGIKGKESSIISLNNNINTDHQNKRKIDTHLKNFTIEMKYINDALKEFGSTYDPQQGKQLIAYKKNKSEFLEKYRKGKK